MTPPTTEQLQSLLRLAEKATPGPWEYSDNDESVYGKDGRGLITCPIGDGNAAFIAAADPTTIRALVEELIAARAEIAELKEKIPLQNGFYGTCELCRRPHTKNSSNAANCTIDGTDQLPCPICRRGP